MNDCVDNRKEHWSLLVKPTHDCNLNCKYCYDEPMRRRFAGKKMDIKTIDYILNLATNYAKNIQWIWHGGEPTLMSTEWYEEVQEVFYKYASKSNITQSMQSNGLNLDEKWAKINQNLKIDIGVSYDVFDQDIRVGSDMKNMEEIISNYNSCGGQCGSITVINKSNYKKQIEIYEHFKHKVKSSCAFNHVFSTAKTQENQLEIPVENYVKEFEKFYSYWINDSSHEAVQERTAMIFTQLVSGILNPICSYSDCRKSWISVNPVGIIYPCDRFIPRKYEIGNIMDFNSIEEIYNSSQHKLYCYEIQKRLMTHCAECGYLQYCKGGCNANHITVAGDGSGIDEFSCGIFKNEFNIVYKTFRELEIYNRKYNKNFIKFILDNIIFTPNEIKEFLNYKGVNINELKYNNEGKELLNCSEFKLFRIFNQTDGEINGHINFIKPQMSININLDEKYNLNDIKKKRFNAMETIFYKKFDDIIELLERRV